MERSQGLSQEREDGIWFKHVDTVCYSCVYLFEKHLLYIYYILSAMSALEGTSTKHGFNPPVACSSLEKFMLLAVH